MDICPVCNKKVSRQARKILCKSCHKFIHKNCTGLLRHEYECAQSDTSWFCKCCTECLFAFNNLEDDQDFLKSILDISLYPGVLCEQGLLPSVFNPFDINEDDDDILDYQGDLDPDKCYFNQYSHQLIRNCNYFVGDSFNRHLSRNCISNQSFSVLHSNIRSMPANLTSFLSYLEVLDHHFSVIGLTETWLKPSNISAYGIEGYHHVGRTRLKKTGGGVSLFVSHEFAFTELLEMCVIEDYIECLFIKLSINNSPCIVGVVYRPPNSDIDSFNDKMNDILSQISNTTCYIMGDFNLDLLKHENHLPTSIFLDNMYANSQIPLIYKPTRETKSTATLIDNIFTNNYKVNDHLLQGLLITDVSDHYIIFHI